MPNILITTGYAEASSSQTEIINVQNENPDCPELEDFPMDIYAAVGVYFVFDPVVCGGYFEDDSGGHSSNKCFKYTESRWQDFTEMIYKRHFSFKCVEQ